MTDFRPQLLVLILGAFLAASVNAFAAEKAGDHKALQAAISGVRGDLSARREEWQGEIERSIRELEADVQQWKVRAEEQKETARREADGKVRQLQEKMAEARRRADELKGQSEATVRDQEGELVKFLEDLRKTLREAAPPTRTSGERR